ncbi:MAG: hypothetical protein IIX16_03690 [Clostridia bacterium]|nr:hypothetical protein [Clostridia bacterium]
MGFFEYISQHWYAGAALVLLVILTVFVWIRAAISGKKRSEERERIIAEIEREKALRKEFKTVDDSTFSKADDYRLIIGLCAYIQQKIENETDMNAAFSALSEIEKYAYVLGYVFEDSKKGLSEFFRANGEPLLSVSLDAVRKVIGGDFAEIFEKEFVMLDENDETTSVDNKELDVLDSRFSTIIENEGSEVYAKVASYLRLNKNYFLN